MFRPDQMQVTGPIDIALPGGRHVPGMINIEIDGSIRVNFQDVDFSKDLILDALQGNVYSLNVGYTHSNTDERDA